MRRLIQILKTIAVLIIVLVACAFLLPAKIEVSRSVHIDAPAAAIFPHINSMSGTQNWSPWLSRDPEIILNHSGPDQGVGNAMTWSSDVPSVGNGSQIITASVLNERVDTALDFGPQGNATAFFILTPEDSGANVTGTNVTGTNVTGTNVTWGFETDLGMNPIARWMGLMFDSWIGADYELGLANLKALVEK